jgi:hypothetical protein
MDIPLHRADYLEAKRLLEVVGVPVDEEDANQTTALHLASANGKLNLVRLLLKHGADVNHRSERLGIVNTPLQIASLTGMVGVVKLLLSHGADPEAQDLLGMTALQQAAFGGRLQVIKVLLEQQNEHLGADDDEEEEEEEEGEGRRRRRARGGTVNLNHQNLKGETAFDLADKAGMWEVAFYLFEKGCLSSDLLPLSPSSSSPSSSQVLQVQRRQLARWNRVYHLGDLPPPSCQGSLVPMRTGNNKNNKLCLFSGSTYQSRTSRRLHSIFTVNPTEITFNVMPDVLQALQQEQQQKELEEQEQEEQEQEQEGKGEEKVAEAKEEGEEEGKKREEKKKKKKKKKVIRGGLRHGSVGLSKRRMGRTLERRSKRVVVYLHTEGDDPNDAPAASIQTDRFFVYPSSISSDSSDPSPKNKKSGKVRYFLFFTHTHTHNTQLQMIDN